VNAGLARFDDARARAFYDVALERVRLLPGVVAAGWTTIIPSNGLMVHVVDIEGYRSSDGKEPEFYVAQVSPDYFAAAGTRILRGRGFTRDDRSGSAPVAIVSRTAAERFWPGRDAVGRHMRPGDGEWRTIVGIAEDVTVRRLGEEAVPYVFYPFDQPSGGMVGPTDPAHLFVRVDGDPRDALGVLSGQLRSVDPQIPVYDVMPFAEHVRDLVMPQQMGATLLGLFSLLASSLASVGLYGVASYVAQSRTRELGIRIALGANARDVRALVLRHGVAPAAAGIAAGVGLALWAAQSVRAFLYDVSPSDPVTFAGVAAGLLLIAWFATWLPARRAARIDPVTALRVR
jgi:predicted permease